MKRTVNHTNTLKEIVRIHKIMTNVNDHLKSKAKTLMNSDTMTTTVIYHQLDKTLRNKFQII